MVKLSPRQCRLTLALTSLLLPAAVFAGNASVAYSDTGPAVITDGTGLDMGGSDSALYLDVVLNGRPTGKLVQFAQHGDQIWASQATLEQLGIKLPAGLPDPLPLNTLPGAQVDYDAGNQRLSLLVPVDMLNIAPSMLNASQAGVPQATASPGLLLNYDLYGSRSSDGSGSLSSFTELRAFGNAGLFDTTYLLQSEHSKASGWRGSSVRLDSFWRRSFPEHMLTLTVGDTLTGALDWSRPTRIGGIQLSRNFNLQPYRITTPIPVFTGKATTPSDVELYVNGIKQYSGQVDPGPFELNGPPVITGSGDAQVVLTDAMGRSTTIDFPFYTTDQLLQKGLSDWSGSIGFVREHYAVNSFDYGHDPAANGTWRYGITDSFTAKAHAEAINGLVNAGAGGVMLLGRAGVLHGSFAHSSNRDGSGNLTSVGYSWRDDHLNLSLDSTRTHGNWRDVASRYGSLPPSVSERALVGVSTDHAGSFSASYLNLRYPEQPGSRYANGFWSKAFGNLAVNVSLNQNLDNHADRSVFVGLSLSLDSHIQLGGSLQHDQDSTQLNLNASKPIPGDGGFGWRSQAQLGDGHHGGLAEAGYRGRYGEVRGGLGANSGDNYGYAEATGSLVLMGGHAFAARRVDNAFAVVSTDGVAHVPVTLENRVIGQTDDDGLLLVTPLNAWQENKLAIDPMELPANVRIQRVKTVATPRDSSGTLVDFGIKPVHAASVVLVDAHGTPIPVGSRVRLAGQDGEASVVGFDGIAYLDTLDRHNRIEVQTDAGRCQAAFDYPEDAGNVPQIGPVTCHEVTP